MSDLIKREDAIKAMEQRYEDILRTFKRKVKVGEKAIVLDMIGCVKNLPSADTEIEIIKAEAYAKGIDSERKRISDWCRPSGEWIPCTKSGLTLTELMRREGQKWYGYRCSNCNHIYKGNALTDCNFCCKCGARMKGADDEDCH